MLTFLVLHVFSHHYWYFILFLWKKIYVKQLRTDFVYVKFLTCDIFSHNHNVCTVDSQNKLSYIIHWIGVLTDLFSYQISGVIVYNHESES
jgi:hypothetical protein